MKFRVALVLWLAITSVVRGDETTVFNKMFGPTVAPLQVVEQPTLPVAELKPTVDKKVLLDNLQKLKSSLKAQAITAAENTPVPLESIYPVMLQDILAHSEADRPFLRYLDLTAVYPTQRKALAACTSFALNSLSWSNSIVVPQMVDGSDGRLLRINYAWYCRNAIDLENWFAAWEKMTAHDPYYRQPWVPYDYGTAVSVATGSQGCIMRADWFIFYAMKQDNDKTPDQIEGFYSDFLALPNTEAQLLAFLRVRLDEARELGTDRRGLVVKSGTSSDAPPVAFNNRRVNRAPAVLTPHGGYFYHTQDYNTSVGNENVFTNPLSDDKDGGEYLWSQPNFLQGYYLTAAVLEADGKTPVLENGKPKYAQVSEVPIDIASSNFSHKRVKYDTCTHCHVRGVNTYKDSLEETLLRLSEPGGAVQLTESKIGEIMTANQLFAGDVKSFVLADQLNYSMAVQRATGMDVDAFAETWKQQLESYELALSPRKAAWEFGTANIQTYLADAVVSTTEGSLLALIKAGFDEQVIHRDTFEAQFQNGKLLNQVKTNVASGIGPTIAVPVPATVIVETPPVVTSTVNPAPEATWYIRSFPTARKLNQFHKWPKAGEPALTTAQVIEWIKSGKIDAETEVLQVGNPGWFAASRVFPNHFEGK